MCFTPTDSCESAIAVPQNNACSALLPLLVTRPTHTLVTTTRTCVETMARASVLAVAVALLCAAAAAHAADSAFPSTCTGTTNTLPVWDGEPTLLASVPNGHKYIVNAVDPPLHVVHVYGTPYVCLPRSAHPRPRVPRPPRRGCGVGCTVTGVPHLAVPRPGGCVLLRACLCV